MKVLNFNCVEELVKDILVNVPATRDSDNLLYSVIINRAGLGRMTCNRLFTDFNKLDLPSFKTVERTRRKIQSECPELKASKEVQDGRTDREEEFIEYARN